MQKTLRITVLGDSIAAGWSDDAMTGWADRLARALATGGRRAALTNLAVPGNTTGDVLRGMKADLRPGDADVLIIGAGINDLCRWGRPDGPQSTTPQQRSENWDHILDHAVASGARVIVMGILPVDESRNDPAEGLYHTNEGIVQTNRLIAEKCAARGIAFADNRDGFAAAGVAGMLADAVHPNAAGHAWLAQKMRPVLQRVLRPARAKDLQHKEKGGPKTAPLKSR